MLRPVCALGKGKTRMVNQEKGAKEKKQLTTCKGQKGNRGVEWGKGNVGSVDYRSNRTKSSWRDGQ